MRNILYMLGSILCLLSSCSNGVDYGEQYKKTLFIVNSKEQIYYASHSASTQSRGNISVYVTGSQLPQEDIHAAYKIDEEALRAYNQKEYGDNESLYLTLLPSDLYSLESTEIVVKKGEPYGCLYFTINTQALNPAKVYVLPITLVDAQGGYEISESLRTILYIVQVESPFAGDYQSEIRQDDVFQGEFSKKAMALGASKILVPLAAKSNAISDASLNYNTDFYQITIREDNSVIIEPYLQSVVSQQIDQSSYYDPEERIFHLFYVTKDKYEEDILVHEIMKAI